MLSLYWSIGSDIIKKKRELGWGAQVIEQLSVDLTRSFPNDKGYSVRNLHYMRRFAENYPDFPILQVPLAEFKVLPISQAALAELADEKDYVEIPLPTISWYHLKLHCYVVVELKAVEFIPEFLSKLNFYISAVDEYVKAPEDKPTIGLLLCRSKSNKKAEFALRGITQPMGIAQYETEKLFNDVASALPTIEEIEKELLNDNS